MHPRIPGQKFPECPSLDAICLQSILGSGHHPYPLQAPRPKPLMPLTAKPTFTQASSPDDSLLSSQLQPVAVPPHTLPGLTLEGHGSPAPSSISRALCLGPAHLKALPRVQSLLEAGGPRGGQGGDCGSCRLFVSHPLHPKAAGQRGSLFMEVRGRLQLRSPQSWSPEASSLCLYGVAQWRGAATSSPFAEFPPYCSRALHFAHCTPLAWPP